MTVFKGLTGGLRGLLVGIAIMAAIGLPLVVASLASDFLSAQMSWSRTFAFAVVLFLELCVALGAAFQIWGGSGDQSIVPSSVSPRLR